VAGASGTTTVARRAATLASGSAVAAGWVPLVIGAERCKACELCILACPHDALALDGTVVNRLGYHPIVLVAPERCTSCAFCARVCPDAVFTIYAPLKAGAA